MIELHDRLNPNNSVFVDAKEISSIEPCGYGSGRHDGTENEIHHKKRRAS